MPSIEQNLSQWDKDYTWSQQGDEWSSAWGGAESQWFCTIFPRIQAFLPTESMLEIAPGFGRWTQFLKNHCERLVAVDLSGRCVEACKERFADETHIDYHVNDGKSLSMVEDKSVDFLFCFDSLVHAEMDVLEAYLEQLASKLSSNGVAFIHHSNLAAFVNPDTGEFLEGIQNPHWRGKSVSAAGVAAYCTKVGLQCISQEIVNWGVDHCTDTFTTCCLRTSRISRENRVWVNPDFMKEAGYVAKISELYARKGLFGVNVQ